MKYMIPLQIVLLVLWFTAFPTASAWLIFLPTLVALFYLVMVLVVITIVAVKGGR